MHLFCRLVQAVNTRAVFHRNTHRNTHVHKCAHFAQKHVRACKLVKAFWKLGSHVMRTLIRVAGMYIEGTLIKRAHIPLAIHQAVFSEACISVKKPSLAKRSGCCLRQCGSAWSIHLQGMQPLALRAMAFRLKLLLSESSK